MNLCDRSHREVCFEGRWDECPVCELFGEIANLKDTIGSHKSLEETMRQEISELKALNERIKEEKDE